jgi:hypothetical protein
MKKLLFILTLLISGLSYSQDKKINPTNLGCLRLGMSYDELVESKCIIEKFTLSSKYKLHPKLNTIENYRFNDSILSYYKVDKIKISHGIEVESVELRFYNDSLYYIKIDDPSLLSSLKYKYGEPNDVKSYDGRTIDWIWDTNNKTTLKHSRDDYYNHYTEFYYSDFFIKVVPILIEQALKYNDIKEQEKIEYERKLKEEEKKKHLGF